MGEAATFVELTGDAGALLLAAVTVAFCEGTVTAECELAAEPDPATEVMLAVLLVSIEA